MVYKRRNDSTNFADDRRDDLARFYTAVNRMDQGVGLILNELKIAGRVDDTLIVFFSDNGLPFPSGKTNLFTNQGQGEPCIVVNPLSTTPAHRSKQIVSSLDFAVTILDAVKILPDYKEGEKLIKDFLNNEENYRNLS